MCWSKMENKLYDDLMSPLEMDNFDRSLWNDKCDYMNIAKCTSLNPNNYNFITMQLNIRSLASHQSSLKQIIKTLERKHFPVDIVLLCETFLTDHTVNQTRIPGYSLIENHRIVSKGGGTAILIKNGIQYKQRLDLEEFYEKELEYTFTEIEAKNGKGFVIGNLYKSLNTSEKKMITHLHRICPTVYNEKAHKELILGLDHNMDLL